MAERVGAGKDENLDLPALNSRLIVRALDPEPGDLGSQIVVRLGRNFLTGRRRRDDDIRGHTVRRPLSWQSRASRVQQSPSNCTTDRTVRPEDRVERQTVRAVQRLQGSRRAQYT